MSLRKFLGGGGGGLVERVLNVSLKPLPVSFFLQGRQFHFERSILFIAWLVAPISFITIYFDLNLRHFWRHLILFNPFAIYSFKYKVYGVKRGLWR